LALGGDTKFIDDGREIVWDDKIILSFGPRTKETNLQVQKITELRQIASNLLDAFIDYKGVTKSLNPAVNAPCSVEVPIKNTPPPKRGGQVSRKMLPPRIKDCTENIFHSNSKCMSTKG
jgi:hypothetical protein